MPTYIVRPTATAKNDWDTDAGTAHAALDDVVTDPTVPTTGSDRVFTNVASEIVTVDLADLAIPPLERVVRIDGKWYIISGVGSALTATLAISGSGDLGTPTAVGASSTGWVTNTFMGFASQAQINNLQVKVQKSSGANTDEIDAAYAVITTVASESQPDLPGIPNIPSMN